MAYYHFFSLALALALLVPSLVLFIECLAARRSVEVGAPGIAPRPTVAALIPAHDEESGIAATVAELHVQLRKGDRLLVVADNCTDRTADFAASAGAEVIERKASGRGKGFALAFGVRHLAADPPEVVIVVDADCRLSPNAIDQLARRAQATGRPVQAEYLMLPPRCSNGRCALNALAFLLRNQVRMRGLQRLGLPCHLTGSGMAIPWQVLRRAPPLDANLVEDMVLGIELALAGAPPVHCSQATVSSVLPASGHAQLGQRRRWEHGHLATMLSYGPRLLAAGARRARLDLCAMGLDLMVPPLALLVMLLFGLAAINLVALAFGAAPWPLLLNLSALGFVLVAVGSAWWRFARRLLPLGALLAAPLYVVWKIPLYVGFFLRGRHKHWERTARSKAEDQQAA